MAQAAAQPLLCDIDPNNPVNGLMEQPRARQHQTKLMVATRPNATDNNEWNWLKVYCKNRRGVRLRDVL